MVRRLAKLASLSSGDVRLLASAWAWTAAARLALSVFSFDTVHRLAHRPVRENSGSAERVAWAVGAVRRNFPGTTCLPEAVAATALLRDRGIAAVLRVGVAKGDDGQVLGHAWVEHDGQVIVGQTDTDTDYRPFDAVERGRQ